jgi:hypothetical protein
LACVHHEVASRIYGLPVVVDCAVAVERLAALRRPGILHRAAR